MIILYFRVCFVFLLSDPSKVVVRRVSAHVHIHVNVHQGGIWTLSYVLFSYLRPPSVHVHMNSLYFP